MTTDHFLTILNEARELFECTGLDRPPDAGQVIDYIEARVKGAEKARPLLEETLHTPVGDLHLEPGWLKPR